MNTHLPIDLHHCVLHTMYMYSHHGIGGHNNDDITTVTLVTDWPMMTSLQ